MPSFRPFVIATLIASSTLLAACGGGHPPAAGTAATARSTGGPIIGAIDRALDRAAEKVSTKDITFTPRGNDISIWGVGNGGSLHGDEATITPKGDLIIHGKAVALTAAQRADVLAYRAQLVGVAQEGIEVGRQGAALGVGAAREALAAVFDGKSGTQIQRGVDARAAEIRKAAATLCNRMPALRASQQKLAAAVPEFAPYATLTSHDVDDCRREALQDHAANH